MLFRIIALAIIAACAAVPALLSTSATGADQAGKTAERDEKGGPLVIYSGRSKSLVGPLMDRFTSETGIQIEVRYAGSTDMANLLIEEGRRTPADVFLSQDPGALGAVGDRGLLVALDSDALQRVPAAYRALDGVWVGVSGRARVLAHSTIRCDADALPASVLELTEPHWRGRVGWAPSNASFQLFITAMRHHHGDDATRRWLQAMKRSGVRDYTSNRPIIQAIADGEIDLGLTNHYYLAGFQRERGADFPVANHFLPDDVGGMMSVAGVGVLTESKRRASAARFVEFLLSDQTQRWFARETGEFPLTTEAPAPEGAAAPDIRALERLDIDLGSLSDLRATLDMLRETGVLP
ncbi:MAG: iron ABC transporter substrate-binding protein [Phycisphaeraceae bacterium]|nr:MAG: iron ABC transporter substrate-binding protein [Phycisphaeraceae bacterium]